MPQDRFMIAPFTEGLVNAVRPWLIPDNAFAILQNAYVYRGRLRKRFGARLLDTSVATEFQQQRSRLRINIGTTAAITGNFGPFVVPGAIFQAGQQFTIGTTYFTITSNVPGAQPMLSTGVATGTFDVATGTVVITGNNENPSTSIYYYPSLPVMGFTNYELAPINDEPTFAFDQQFAYEFTATGWEILGPVPPAAGSGLWTGSDSQFFWAITWRGTQANNNILFVTNYNAADQIKYWDGTNWTTINPSIGGGNTLESARLLISFQGRLIALNTIENIAAINQTFRNRARWSQYGSPLQADAWHDPDITPGKGNFTDAATQEAIVSAQFIKDRLIVFFERSTWELAYTGNQIQPFIWQKINTELGVESTFSRVPFDKAILGIGNTGIHACNGSNVERIDAKIPQEVFNIQNQNDGVLRVHGIRDYYNELVYWTFPGLNGNVIDGDKNPTYPTRVLVYNYETNSWAFNTDSITAFGYIQNISDITWQSEEEQWQNEIDIWNSARFISEFRNIVAGNQQGWTFLLDTDNTRNSQSLQITDIAVVGLIITLTIYEHNLVEDEYIFIDNIVGLTNLNGMIYQVQTILDRNTIVIFAQNVPVGAYLGRGTCERVSNLDIRTKQFNFYQQQGKNAYISKVDCMIDHTANGQVTVDYFVSTNIIDLVPASQLTNAILGTNILETSAYASIPFEALQTRLWHPLYLQAEGEVIQLRIYLADDPNALADDTQIRNTNIAFSDFQLHAMVFYAQPVSRLQ